MRADHIEVSWDADNRNWVVRVQVGSEVIRRHCRLPSDADDQNLRKAAEQTVVDEGYDFDPSRIAIIRREHSTGRDG